MCRFIFVCLIILFINNIQNIKASAQCKLNDAYLKRIISNAGENGERGETGAKGQKGEKGEQGQRGITVLGPPGEPGPPPSDIEEGSDQSPGDEANPIKNICKVEAPDDDDEYYIKPKGYAAMFKVRCNKGKSCVFPKNSTIFALKKEKYWLGTTTSLLQEVYGMYTSQLSWLQKNSQEVKQIIRLHCLNTAPVHDDVNLSLKLMTWNDVTIGPEPTALTPLQYKIIFDGCKNSPKDKWSYTDIEIVSGIPNRLPITDFLFNDVREGEQNVKIENFELCFM